MSSKNRSLLWILVGVVLLFVCCCMIFASMGLSLLLGPLFVSQQSEPPIIVVTQVATPRMPLASATPAASISPQTTPAPGSTADRRATRAPETTLQALPTEDGEAQALLADEMPAADPRDLALRLNPGAGEIPVVVNATPPGYAVGDKARFWISNTDTQDHRQITAVLRYMTGHVAMWVEEGGDLDQRDLEASADRFEEKTYPTNREFFGSEWTPGVDNDVRLHILHAGGLGDVTAGYYSSADEYSRQVNEYSNEREMFYVSTDAGSAAPNTDYYDGTLAHEFQHMIHWNNDRNESSWVNEGMSELASQLNGFDPGGFDTWYSLRPDTQLTTWDASIDDNGEHYGASYLFMTYFLDRFGEELTKAVVASPKNGVSGFDDALAKVGRPERFDAIFADWVIANYLDLPNADPRGRFGYATIDPNPMALAETYRNYPAEASAQVNQYGVDYFRLRGKGPLKIRFEGQQQVGLVRATPQGTHAWWSNRGDQSDSTLTRAFDLRDVRSATLGFSLWYDIEGGWDYAYVAASTDGGKTWQVLPGRHTTEEDPVGNAFGPGWTGISGVPFVSGDESRGQEPVWVEEQVDLTPFAGRQVQIRFEYVTDDAVNNPGLLLDNIAIPEIGYRDDGEGGTAGWAAAGWALTDNLLNQRWLVQLIAVGRDRISVERMAVGLDGRGELDVPDVGTLRMVVLAISALTSVTTEPAHYSFTITPR